jgi:hypothetical protein
MRCTFKWGTLLKLTAVFKNKFGLLTMEFLEDLNIFNKMEVNYEQVSTNSVIYSMPGRHILQIIN